MPPLRRPAGTAWIAGVLAGVVVALAATGELRAQEAAPAGERAASLQRFGYDALEREDPVRAWESFRWALTLSPGALDALVGLGRSHLLLGRASVATAYAEHVLQRDVVRQEAMALLVRAQIRARRFDEAVLAAERFVQRLEEPTAELLAALGSALFRVQKSDDAAAVYRRVLALDPREPEAHLRLGSGLSTPQQVEITRAMRLAVAAMRDGRIDEAIERLFAALAAQGSDPVLHRLLGEALFQRRADASMASQDPAFRMLERALPRVDASRLPVGEFMAAYPLLGERRRVVVDRVMCMFASRLDKLVALGARHDLLLELERTTDAPSRESLRGRRTFDGRVWDDVRGIGGLHAATGIEALDEAASFGFDTLAHEIAHQVHYYALAQVDRVRIRMLYRKAKAEGRFLDYYAASNEAEYFGQGVEAFASLAKRPGGETTHGHTRFELRRVDPELHELIAGIVDHDPLRGVSSGAAGGGGGAGGGGAGGGEAREELLQACVEVALRCGRPEDAVVAAEMMAVGDARDRALQRARSAVLAAREY